MNYLVEHFADEATSTKLIPRKYEPGKEKELGGETEAWMRHQFYDSYVEGSLMSVLQIKLVFDGEPLSFPFHGPSLVLTVC